MSQPSLQHGTSAEHPPESARSGGADPAQLAVTIYDSSSDLGHPLQLLQGMLRDFWLGRELAWRLFVRNLRGMYRQTILGIFWIFLPPLANTAIWVFLRSRNVFSFSTGTGEGGASVDPALYILAGMVLWQAFLEAFLMPLESLTKNRSMITKLNFPREALVLEGFAEVLFNLAVRSLVLVGAFLLFGQVIPWAGWMFAIPFGLLLVALATGLGLILAPIGSLYHDVGRFLAMAAPFWMILTPIIYAAPLEWPGSLLNWLNPASPLLVLARDLLVFGSSQHWQAGWVFAGAALPVLLAGLVVWRVSIPALVERMTS